MTADTSLRDARVLITGAGGFIGRHLVERLQADGADVFGVTREECDLTDEAAVHRVVGGFRPEVVFHLAAARALSTGAERSSTSLVNAMSGLWVLESVGADCRAVVQLGSSTEYAQTDGPMGESTPLRPRGFFGKTKAAGSLLLTAAAIERGIPARVLRAFQVYGPSDKAHRFIPTVLSAARSGDAIPLTAPGLRRDWVWVGDVVEACLRSVAIEEVGSPRHFNIGTGVQTANEEVIRLAEQVTGRRIAALPGAFDSRLWDTGSWVCDPTAAARDLGWAPTITLSEGLRRCWEAS